MTNKVTNMIDINEVVEIKRDMDLFQTHGYGIVSQTVMTMKGLTMQAKALYCYLQTYKGKDSMVYPSQKTIMSDLAIGDIKTLRRYMKQLQEFGLIKIQKTFDKSKGQYSNNVYYIAESFSNMEKWKNEYAELKNATTKKETEIVEVVVKEDSKTKEEIKDEIAEVEIQNILSSEHGEIAQKRFNQLGLIDDYFCNADMTYKLNSLKETLRQVDKIYL